MVGGSEGNCQFRSGVEGGSCKRAGTARETEERLPLPRVVVAAECGCVGRETLQVGSRWWS